MKLRALILTLSLIGLFSCKEDKPNLNLTLIREKCLSQTDKIDSKNLNWEMLNEIDSLTFFQLPESYKYLEGDDKMYFYYFTEMEKNSLFSTIAESQFGLFVNLFLVSKSNSQIIDDFAINIDGSEGGWFGKKTGKFQDNGIVFYSHDTIYEPLNDSILTTTIDVKTFKIVFAEKEFERLLIDSTNNYFEEKINK